MYFKTNCTQGFLLPLECGLSFKNKHLGYFFSSNFMVYSEVGKALWSEKS